MKKKINKTSEEHTIFVNNILMASQRPITCSIAIKSNEYSTLTNSKTYFPTSNENDCDLESKISRYCDNIRAIFFDLDNTLIPTRLGDKKACNKIAEILETRYAFERDEAILTTQNYLKSFRRCPDNVQTTLDAWRIHLWLEALPSRFKSLAEIIYRLWLDVRYNYLCLTSEYKDLLRYLRQLNYRLALITNGTSNAQWEKIKKLNIQKYFDYILISAEVPWEKPHPNIFYAACKFLQVKPSQCAMVGDKLETDIQGGLKAGLGVTFWLPVISDTTNHYTYDDEKEYIENKATFTLRDLLDIYKYFNLRKQSEKYMDTEQVPDYCQIDDYRHCNLLLQEGAYNENETENSSDSTN